MKFSLSWLKMHLHTEAPLDRLTETLSSIGLEVEGVEDRAASLAPFRTARIIEAVPHPNADRLRVCRVDAGNGEDISVVCGAPNARTGLHVVFAPPGAFIPGSGITLKIGEIRGVKSAGMLVSAREMGLGDEHDGILELPEGTPAGLAYANWAGLDDPVIEIGVTPNRGDALSVRGVARDLAAAGLGILKPYAIKTVESGFESQIRWQNDFPDACPWILGRTISGVTQNVLSPDWLVKRLKSAGIQPKLALVDITNYFSLDIGRPLHVFDVGRLGGDVLTIRRGAGELIEGLNKLEYTMHSDDIVIADQLWVQSLAGVMGSHRSRVDYTTDTVFLECALFDSVRVGRTGRRHQINSDARQRFERGLDQALLPDALEAATAMILDLCGGKPSEVVSAGAEPAWQRHASLRFERLAGLGGANVAADEARAVLERLGFATMARNEAKITVAVPPWRNDIAGDATLDQSPALDAAKAATASLGAAEIAPECDLIEEVLRIRGLDLVTAVSLPRAATVPGASMSPRQARTALARRLLASRGLAECVTYSFTARSDAALFGDVPDSLTLKNPIAADLDQMRPTPLVTLVQAAKRNFARGLDQAGLFEIGPGYGEAGQALLAAGLRAGVPARHWQGAAPAPDAMDAKADVLAVLAALGVPAESLSVTADAPSHFHPGRSGVVRQGPKIVLARFGALHPSLLEPQACAFEIFLDAVPDPKRRKRAAPDLPPLQPVRRDFAFVVASDTAADSVLRAARQADRALIARVDLFDVYQGENVPDGQKSLGIEVVFQPRERTLTDQEIEAACALVVGAVGKATGARLR